MVLFFISCFQNVNSGAGGHYYSLLQMHRALTKPSKIVVFGDFIPQVYEAEDIIFIKTTRANALDADVSALMQIPQVEVIHLYDIDVALIGSKIASKLKVPLVATKPGGPPIKRWSLSFQNQVVFHPFDYDFFTRRGPLAPKNICQIPNRVSWPKAPAQDRPSPFSGAAPGALKLLRIARIGSTYQHSIKQAINLADKINAECGPAVLALVGKVQEQKVLDEINELIATRPYVTLHGEKTFTLNASELIPYADVVIGTGRGLIEGLSYGKPIFFPVANEPLPCFMDEHSYAEAFYHNFSQRVPKSDIVDPEARFRDFANILKQGSFELTCELSKKLFRQDHLVEVGAEKLLDFYRQIKTPERSRDFYLKYAHRRALRAMKALLKEG